MFCLCSDVQTLHCKLCPVLTVCKSLEFTAIKKAFRDLDNKSSKSADEAPVNIRSLKRGCKLRPVLNKMVALT